MIFDTIANAERYAPLHPLFPQVFKYIRTKNLHALASGKHSIIANDLFAIVERVPGRTREEAQLECHRKYIDIQLVLDGIDEMGWKPLADCHQPVSDYDELADINFFYDSPSSWIVTPPNTFCIFFPEDTHAPLVSEYNIHKIVFKIMV
jgi:YhcH/YjgK/YiaL family protein